jgi:hypothetical protein
MSKDKLPNDLNTIAQYVDQKAKSTDRKPTRNLTAADLNFDSYVEIMASLERIDAKLGQLLEDRDELLAVLKDAYKYINCKVAANFENGGLLGRMGRAIERAEGKQ